MHKTVGIDSGSAKRPKHKLYALLLATVVAFACPAGVNAQVAANMDRPQHCRLSTFSWSMAIY